MVEVTTEAMTCAPVTAPRYLRKANVPDEVNFVRNS